MYLSEVFDRLSNGELAGHALSGAESGFGIKESNYPIVIHNINAALSAVHKRFNIKTGEVIIQQYDQITTYYLDSRFAVTNTESTEPVKYIEDSPYMPYRDTALRVEQVFDEEGREYPLNDKTEVWSLYTPTENSIQIPFPDSANQLSVIYRSDHPRLKVLDSSEILKQIVEVNGAFIEPVLLYAAAAILSSKPTLDGINPGTELSMRYEIACRLIETKGLGPQDNTTNLKLNARGFA